MSVKSTPWILGGHVNPEAPCRLFCLSHSGSGASQFFSWRKSLPPMLDLCPIQLPGRENRLREAPLTEINRIAEILSEELEPYFDRPYILYGYSWSAIIVFELARRLRIRGIPPAISLYALARRAPHLPETKPPLRHLPDDLFLLELKRRYDGMSPIVLRERELMQLLLPTLRADVTAYETYDYSEEEPLDCAIRVFGGTSDVTTTEDELRGWQRHTNGSFEITMLRGDHFFIRDNRASVLDSIAKDIPSNSLPRWNRIYSGA
ncbi:MAG: thioesterase [Verrucomicrobia bacterium]|nr:thioesterase [Verrucomicrobiota bacterium]